ncbi:LUD domain-containing protein [Streptomyces sp. NPDC047002]|uniref:LutC/YkgG family protein n=1 Tax=Streptomyces sp. NPDC047002 TaxID=3155475 RepID=UPI003451B636
MSGREPTGARAEVLARVRAALADRPEPPPVPREYDTARAHGDLVELARERIEDYRATVRRVPAARLPHAVADLLALRGSRRVVAPPGLPQEWRSGPGAAGVTWLRDLPPLALAELDGADAVLTGCAAVIAETGTVVLDGGPGQGRRALTLVPDRHLCVVRAGQIVATVPEAMARLSPVRPLTFVSGPSATSDIELERVEGVHGPRTLDVLLVDEGPADA